MIESLLRNKSVLQGMAKEESCREWIRKRPAGEPRRAAALMITTIEDEGFWKKAQEVKDVLQPVMLALRQFDTYEARTGDVVYVMRKLRAALERVKLDDLFTPSLLEMAHGADESGVMGAEEAREKIVAMFSRRWKEFQSFSHIAGFLLNPRTLLKREQLQDDIEQSSAAFNSFVQRAYSSDDALSLITDMAAWLDGKGPLKLSEELEVLAANKLPAYQYWYTVGNMGVSGLPKLRLLALRVLSQVRSVLLFGTKHSHGRAADCVCWHERVELVVLSRRSQQEAQPTHSRACSSAPVHLLERKEAG